MTSRLDPNLDLFMIFDTWSPRTHSGKGLDATTGTVSAQGLKGGPAKSSSPWDLGPSQLNSLSNRDAQTVENGPGGFGLSDWK